MSEWALAAEVARSVFVGLLLLGPIGWALMWMARATPCEPGDLGTAVGVGYSITLPLMLAERALGAPVLILPFWCLCLVLLRRQWGRLLNRELLRCLVLPLALGLLVFAVNLGDIRFAEGGLSIRAGFDVSDRAVYAVVGEELLRALPPAMQHPLFSGAPFAYSLFPSALGGLFHLYAGADMLPTFLLSLPTFAFVLIGLCVQGFVSEMNVLSPMARWLTALLTVLGGDLSVLFDPRNATTLERTRHFLVFHSFSAECLYYNTWAFGFPLALVALTLAHRWRREGGLGLLLLAGLVTGHLWETKVFAFAPLLLGLVGVAVLERRGRALWLVVVSAAFALPWVSLTFMARGAEQGSPLFLSPLYPVRMSLALIPGLERLGQMAGGASPPLVRVPVLLGATLFFLVGGLGVRLVGLARITRECRLGASLHLHTVASVVAALTLSLLFVGTPVPTDGVQFVMLAQLLLWFYAGPVLADALSGPRLAGRLVALALIALAVANPVRYLARRAFPGSLVPDAAIADRLFVPLSRSTLAACRWLQRQTDVSGRLVLPLGGDPGDATGLKPLYVAALSERRLAVFATNLSIEPARAESLRRAAWVLFETQDAEEGQRALEALNARWVWQEEGRPLRFRSPRLASAFRSGGVTLFEFSSPAPMP
jgi:hypothetical protein